MNIENMNMNEDYNRAAKVRQKNDLLRTTMHPFLGKVILTQGVAHHSQREEIITKVREFKNFTTDNDPHHEHDCAVIKFESSTDGLISIIFKIDYYDSTYVYFSDPYEGKCNRVLTIMLSEEY